MQCMDDWYHYKTKQAIDFSFSYAILGANSHTSFLLQKSGAHMKSLSLALVALLVIPSVSYGMQNDTLFRMY